MLNMFSSKGAMPVLFAAPLGHSTGAWRRWHLLSWLVLVVGLAVTFQAWRSSAQYALHEMQANFDFNVRDAATRITLRMATYEQIVHSSEGFISHADRVNREEFRNFIDKQHFDENFPGMHALSFVKIVPAAQKEHHIAAVREQGFPAYSIHPAGARTLYTSTIFIEPFTGKNLRAFGYDPYAEPARRTAMELARDLDLPVISGKLTLVQENEPSPQAGFVMYLPIFKFGVGHGNLAERRAGIIGWVAAPFRMNDLMNDLYGKQTDTLDIRLFDGEQVSADSLMYASDHESAGRAANAGRFKMTRRIELANHVWTIEVRSRPAFDAKIDRTTPRIVMYTGIGISLLLTLLTLALIASRERALQAARERLERETSYRQMFEDTTSAAFLLDPESGRIVEANLAAAAFWGYSRKQLRDMNLAQIDTGSGEHIMLIAKQISIGKRTQIECRHRLANGQIRNVEVFSGPLTYLGKVLLHSIFHDISIRKQTEQALEESEARSREIAATIGEGVLVTDLKGMITFSNPEAQNLLGWSESGLLDQHFHTLLHHSHANGMPYAPHECAISQMLDSGQPFRSHDDGFWCHDRSRLPVAINATPIIRDHQVIGSVVAFHDITERKRIEADLRVAATAFEAQVGMLVTDVHGVILKANLAFSETSGYATEEVVGQTPRLFKSGRHDAAFYAEMWECIRHTGVWQGEIWDRRKNGEIYPKWLTITAVTSKDGVVTHYVGAHTDITERKAAEDEIKYLAFYDPLTDLPNRRLLRDRLHQALARSARQHRQGALFFIDLDNFKTLNDTLGHDQGDLLLQQVAQRLLVCVREGDTVARLGGDEFVVMLEDLSPRGIEAQTQVEMIGEKILAALNLPYFLSGHEYHNTSSIGITLFGKQHESIEELLKQADLAMYQAKAAGRNALRFFDPEMQDAVTSRVALEKDLRNAVRDGQFTLYYQAQVENRGSVTGAEVLLRWQHPQHGLVFPDTFIPLAEETGLILPLGHWVLETACVQLAAWAGQPDTTHLTLAVNVSIKQLRQPEFVEQVLGVLDRTGADPCKLKLEITESLLMDNVEDTIAKMGVLKAKGVGFALDDFGTGYSSLTYLKRLPLEKLKIDRAFVMDVLTDPNDAAIAKTIVTLAQSLGLAVIAEGVETEAQRDFLASNGCHAYQGYLFSRPLPLHDFEQFLTQNALRATAQ